MSKKRFQLFLTEPQLDILRERAEREDTSVADLIRFAISQSIMPSDMQANKKRKRNSFNKWRDAKTSYEGFPDPKIRDLVFSAFNAGYDAGWVNFQTRHFAEIIEE